MEDLKSYINNDYILESPNKLGIRLSRPINTRKQVNIPDEKFEGLQITMEDDSIRIRKDPIASKYEPKPPSDYDLRLLKKLIPDSVHLSLSEDNRFVLNPYTEIPCAGTSIREFDDTGDEIITEHQKRSDDMFYASLALELIRSDSNCPTCNTELGKFGSHLICTVCNSLYDLDEVDYSQIEDTFKEREVNTEKLGDLFKDALANVGSSPISKHANPVVTTDIATIFEDGENVFYMPQSEYLLDITGGLQKVSHQDAESSTCTRCGTGTQNSTQFKGGIYSHQNQNIKNFVVPYCKTCAKELQTEYRRIVSKNKSKLAVHSL